MGSQHVKILHFADLHLGVETYGRIDPTTGYCSRMVDILNAFDNLVEAAIAERVDLVLFCGDAYKDRSPNPTQQREFARRIRRLSENQINTLILCGNHDLSNAVNRASATEIFDTLAVDNVYVAGKPDLYRIPAGGGILQVITLPWLRRANLMNLDEIKNMDINAIHQQMEEVLTRVVSQLIAKLDPAYPAILAAHAWVKGAKTGSEKGTTIGREPELLISNVIDSKLDYVALGHIHRRQVLSEKPPVVYSGSLVKLDFSDADEEKGFFLVGIEQTETGSRNTRYSFTPVPNRNFITVKVEIPPEDIDPTSTVIQALNQNLESITDAIVRLEITLPQNMEGLLRDNEIRAGLKAAHFVTVAKTIVRITRARLGGDHVAEAITPMDALHAWLENVDFDPDQKKRLLAYGNDIIQQSQYTE
ncbi:MAG: exonuclease SbcCD subunit D [Dehalococcoidaceae bacterium]|nr:exonuclease SbcCD subunit D [Dehalococcoidaceae bacterium]